jgi:Bacteriophage head to tail connecting protein
MQGLYTKRQKFEIIRAQLENERATFTAHWRDLGDFILPRRPRFYTSDVNKGDRRNQKIIDSTATLACRTLRSGMMSGITSPARPWFRLATPDPSLSEMGSVKRWLDDVQRILQTSFLRSNLYNILPIAYGDLGVFGTAPIFVEEVFNGDVMNFSSFPVGSYMISKDHAGKVDTFIREFRMTVRQIVSQFGELDKDGKPSWDNMSDLFVTSGR